MIRKNFCAVLLAAMGLTVVLSGCGPSGSPGDRMIAERNSTNMARLCNMYGFYLSRHGWQGPADEATFKKFISDQPTRVLERMGIDPANVDAIFTSERDDQKFKIRWSVAGSERGDPQAIVFESEGVDGLRMVGFTRPPHKEVEDAEYKKLLGD